MLTSQLEAAQASIREKSYAHFAWLAFDSVPWSSLTRPLAGATVVLLSTCGLYRIDQQAPFDAWNDLGDPSFREIPVDTPADRLRIAHTHYDHQHAGPDPNAVLPMSHFRELVSEGVIGRLYPYAFSFMGYLPEPRQLMTEIAPQVAKRLAEDGVDAAFLTPC
jgi:D-proline reductase (dithiol) PrdB